MRLTPPSLQSGHFGGNARHPHFTDTETEAQNGEGSGSAAHGPVGWGPATGPRGVHALRPEASPMSPSTPAPEAWDPPHFTPCWSGREELQSPVGALPWACALKTSHPWPSTFLESLPEVAWPCPLPQGQASGPLPCPPTLLLLTGALIDQRSNQSPHPGAPRGAAPPQKPVSR